MKVIYHFKCIECKKEISKLMEYNEMELFLSENPCVKCGGEMKRVYGLNAVHFKGSGYTKKMA